MPRKGSKRTKTKTHEKDAPDGAVVLGQGKLKENIPKSIVAKASKVSPTVSELVKDIRKMMLPHTASNLKEKSSNRMKDYVDVAAQLGVSHLFAVSQTKSNLVLRLARTGTGPTLHLKVLNYSLSSQVRANQKRPYDSAKAHMTAPLVVLNNFGLSASRPEISTMKAIFQHAFPSINLQTIKLGDCRRVVLFHLTKEDGTVQVRHYAVRANPVGISRSVKKILQSKIPDLGSLEDVSEFLEGGGGLGALSDSEAEDEASQVELPEKYIGRGNAKAQQSSLKLVELGPRLKLELFKVERGVCEGDVMYHKYEAKTPEEAAQLKAKAEKAHILKHQRRAEQDANVKRKREEKLRQREEKLTKKKRRLEEGATGGEIIGRSDNGRDDEEVDCEGGDCYDDVDDRED